MLNSKVRVLLEDRRSHFIGTLKAVDKHKNLVLGDCEEFRKILSKKPGESEREEKRILGFVLVRGQQIVSITVEGPPPPDESLTPVVLCPIPKNSRLCLGRAQRRRFVTSSSSQQPGLVVGGQMTDPGRSGTTAVTTLSLDRLQRIGRSKGRASRKAGR